MKKNIVKIALLSLFAASLAAVPTVSRADDAVTNAPAASDQTPPVKQGKRGTLFSGKVGALDTNAMTLAVGSLTLQITSDTKITNNGKPATLSEGTVGEAVHGYYKKDADGKSEAVAVRFGGKPGKQKKTSPAGSGSSTGTSGNN